MAHISRPLTHTVANTSKLTGLGLTTIWNLIKDKKLDVVRLPGIKRTLVTDESLVRLFAPDSPSLASSPPKRLRGRPRKSQPIKEPPIAAAMPARRGRTRKLPQRETSA